MGRPINMTANTSEIRAIFRTNCNEGNGRGGQARNDGFEVGVLGSAANEQWAKRSLGKMSGSVGHTSDGKGLTEGLEYSSSALDVVSNNYI